MIRQPIVTFMGHIDHGKTALQDFIRSSTMVEKEPGLITQHIGCSFVPLDVVKKICGNILETLKMEFTIKGILMVDSPGHAAFINLRKRGGNLADIAILVIDINEGVKTQTVECIEILKQYKTPFVVAANKIDLVPGWKSSDLSLLENIQKQQESVRNLFDKKIYEIVGKLSTLGFNSERFDRVDDFTKQIVIVPTSAKTGEGVAELLMVITGLAQKYLEKSLKLHITGPAKGTILEIKEEKGLGKTLDVILYDGTLKKNDTIVIGGLTKAIVTKIKALFEPMPLSEMRDKKTKFNSLNKVVAAAGVKISAPDIDDAIAGMPLSSSKKEEIEKIKQEIQKEVKEVLIETDKQGVVIKADSLGSLEALITLLKEKKIPIRKASIGNITKKDIAEAESNYEQNPLIAVVLGFNVVNDSNLKNENVKVLTNNIIYKLIEDFEKWQQDTIKKEQEKELRTLIRPCKFQIMKGYVFRQNNPAVVGVDILAGTLKIGIPLMKNDGSELTTIKSMQMDQENIDKAERGKQVAVAMGKVTVGRQINEGDVLYSSIPERDFRKMKELKKLLSYEEIELLKEIAKIKRKQNPVWGV